MVLPGDALAPDVVAPVDPMLLPVVPVTDVPMPEDEPADPVVLPAVCANVAEDAKSMTLEMSMTLEVVSASVFISSCPSFDA